MSRVEDLENKVRALYDKKNPERDGWADWLYQHHVFLVAAEAKQLAARYGGVPDLARAAGMLHDIADAEMARNNEKHEERSREIARELLNAAGFSSDEIKTVVDDALRYHSCYEQERPQTPEGKAMASADAVVHLKSDFYLYAFWGVANEGKPYAPAKVWALKKIERDFTSKMFFPEVKDQARPFYEALRDMLNFGRSLNVKDKNMQIKEAKLFSDGGSRGNPGPSAIAYVICKMDDSVVEKSGEYIGITTNNQAEYQAVKAGLSKAHELGIKKLIVNLDSELVVKQLNGQYKIKNQDLLPHFNHAKRLAAKFDEIIFQHVPRVLNAAADKEVNRILDEQAKAG